MASGTSEERSGLNHAGLALLVNALGEQGFPALLLDIAKDIAGAHHLTVIRFDAGLVPHVALAASADGSATARQAGEHYCRSTLNLNDPIRGRMLRRHLDDGVTVSRLALEDMHDDPQRAATYRALALAERWSILGNRGGDWITINLYREIATPSPTGVEDTLLECAPLFHAFVMRHLRLTTMPTPAGQLFTELVARLHPQLSPRQQQVCSRALHGLTNAEIARDLGIGAATVSTLRRRAYERLNVSNLAELFGRCLTEHHG